METTTRLALALALLPTVALSLQWLRNRAPPREIQNYRKEAAVAIRLARRCGRAMRDADTKARTTIWKDGDGPMMESLDIIAKFDTGKQIKPASGRTDIKAWQKSVQTLMRKLQRPRYVMVPLPEFMQRSGRDAFVNNHQMPPYEKSDWKGNADMALEFKYEKYAEAYAESASLLPEANAKLQELESMICCAECCTEGGLSYDDIDLWARLRSLTVIKGLVYPLKVRAYLDHFEKAGDVPLYDVMAV